MKQNYGNKRYDGAICLVNTDNLSKGKRNVLLKLRSIIFLSTELKFRRHNKIIVNSSLNKIIKADPGSVHIIKLIDSFKHIEILSNFPVRTKGIVIIAITKHEVHPVLLQNTKLILNF